LGAHRGHDPTAALEVPACGTLNFPGDEPARPATGAVAPLQLPDIPGDHKARIGSSKGIEKAQHANPLLSHSACEGFVEYYRFNQGRDVIPLYRARDEGAI